MEGTEKTSGFILISVSMSLVVAFWLIGGFFKSYTEELRTMQLEHQTMESDYLAEDVASLVEQQIKEKMESLIPLALNTVLQSELGENKEEVGIFLLKELYFQYLNNIFNLRYGFYESKGNFLTLQLDSTQRIVITVKFYLDTIPGVYQKEAVISYTELKKLKEYKKIQTEFHQKGILEVQINITQTNETTEETIKEETAYMLIGLKEGELGVIKNMSEGIIELEENPVKIEVLSFKTLN
jgi:hypothetical protein